MAKLNRRQVGELLDDLHQTQPAERENVRKHLEDHMAEIIEKIEEDELHGRPQAQHYRKTLAAFTLKTEKPKSFRLEPGRHWGWKALAWLTAAAAAGLITYTGWTVYKYGEHIFKDMVEKYEQNDPYK